MSACAQPGCKGTIEDGYCDACGLAPAGAGASGSLGSAKTSAASTRTGSGKVPMTRSTKSSRSTRSTRSGSLRTGRTATRALGDRPLARPALPQLDPMASLVEGTVPERKRFCSSCDVPLKRDSGFCPKCGTEYSFIPTLKAGDLIAGKYEIKGTIAFGGLGWIYLALDTVLTRWVTMKGLLNSKDPHMLEVAVREREYLAAVKHPKVVGIYDFLTHGDQGFIVMEYVNGKTLMTLRKEHDGPLPVAEAISYIAEILPAFDYLDQLGLVYCDFKPENVMVEEETVKLIDLGAVRRTDDVGGDVYGSLGYTAPEAHEAPTPLSDLYSVARGLAVLVANFDFHGKYVASLPPPEECEVFREHEALYRFLLKATRAKPDERFQSAGEMAEQLIGVLRTVVGETPELGRPDSSMFAPDSDRPSEPGRPESAVDGVPKLKVDLEDAAANVIVAAGALPDADKRFAMFERALKVHPGSLELKLRAVDELVNLGRFGEAEARLAAVQKEAVDRAATTKREDWLVSPTDWRFAWYRGRALLAQGKLKETLATFEELANELPGELAPRQALAIAHEAAGSPDLAIRYYESVSRCDSSFAGAAIRLARCLQGRGDRAAAVAAYRRVPATSNRFASAQMALARLLMSVPAGRTLPELDDLGQASVALESLDGLTDGLELHALRAELLHTAGRLASRLAGGDVMILKQPFRETPLRAAAEAELRTCARQAKTDAERIHFVDEANVVRPRTWV